MRAIMPSQFIFALNAGKLLIVGAIGCHSQSLGSMHDLGPNVPENLMILWFGKFVQIFTT